MSRDVSVFIDPFSHHFERDGLFDVGNEQLNRNDAIVPYAYLREWFSERGVPVRTADVLQRGEAGSAQNIYISLGIRSRYRDLARRPDVTLSAFFGIECPVVEPRIYREWRRARPYFRRFVSYSDADSLAPFVGERIECMKFHLPQARGSVIRELWSRTGRRFLTMIHANKRPRLSRGELYTERMRAVAFFGRTGDIDLYGTNWDHVPYRTGESVLPATVRRAARTIREGWDRVHPDRLLHAVRSSYRGACSSKEETLSGYTFAICFENMELNGWVTEKIFDCFLVGTVPVYLGAPDITDYVPASCFIDMRRFSSYEELADHLRGLTPAEIESYRENARAYLASPRFAPFTKQAFAELVGRFVEEDTGVSLVREPV